MNAFEIVKDSIAKGLIPQMSFVFIAHESAAARHENFACSGEYAHFITHYVFSWAAEKLPNVSFKNNLICGVSSSGLESAYVALKFPNLFSSSLCQSGSFWWNKNFFENLAQYHSLTKSRFWLSIGDKETDFDVSHPPTSMFQDTSQIIGVQRATEALKNCRAEVNLNTYLGGHEFEPWREEPPKALQWMLN